MMATRNGGWYNANRHPMPPWPECRNIHAPSRCECWNCRWSRGQRRFWSVWSDLHTNQSRHPFELAEYPHIADVLDGLEQLATNEGKPTMKAYENVHPPTRRDT